MKRLIENQFLYLWQMIRFRVIGWLVLISLAIILISLQLVGNPKVALFDLYFENSESVKFVYLYFILWFVYFMVPLVIVLNSFKSLWRIITMHLRGLQIPPRNFTVVTLLLMGLVDFIYVFVTLFVMIACTALLKLKPLVFNNMSEWQTMLLLFANNFLGIYLIFFLQGTIGKFNSVLGIIIPAFLLIMTPYLDLKFNPLNNLMIMRASNEGFVFLAVATIVMLVAYWSIERYLNFN